MGSPVSLVSILNVEYLVSLFDVASGNSSKIICLCQNFIFLAKVLVTRQILPWGAHKYVYTSLRLVINGLVLLKAAFHIRPIF